MYSPIKEERAQVSHSSAAPACSAVQLAAIAANAPGQTFADVASGRLEILGRLRPPPTGPRRRRARRRRDPVRAKIALDDPRRAAQAVDVAVRVAKQSSTAITATDRLGAANVARHNCQL